MGSSRKVMMKGAVVVLLGLATLAVASAVQHDCAACERFAPMMSSLQQHGFPGGANKDADKELCERLPHEFRGACANVVDEVGLDKVDVLLASSPDTICSHVTGCHQTSSVTEDMDVLASDSADADAEADADADADDQEEDDDASDADDAEEDDDEDADSDADADEANLDVSRRRRSRGRGRTSASQSRMKNGINTGNQALTLSGQIGLLNAMSGMDSFGRPQMGNPT